jgi:hypothetical protein
MHPSVLEFLGYEGSIIDQRKNFISKTAELFEELPSTDEEDSG